MSHTCANESSDIIDMIDMTDIYGADVTLDQV